MTIKELRESKGLSQGKFAESIGIGRTAIVGYEKGKFKPSANVVDKIKEGYGVDSAAPATESVTPAEKAKPTKRTRKKKEEASAPAEEKAPAAEEKAGSIGVTIKALRKEKGLSQKAFGASIGVSLSTVGAYENGRIKPSEKVLVAIKEVYGSTALDATSVEPPAILAVETTPIEVEPKKRGRKKTAAAAPVSVEAAHAVKTVEKKSRRKKGTVAVIIQSPLGGSITPEEVLVKTGPVDAVYIRVDENKAYWVRGDETGSVDLWE